MSTSTRLLFFLTPLTHFGYNGDITEKQQESSLKVRQTHLHHPLSVGNSMGYKSPPQCNQVGQTKSTYFPKLFKSVLSH